MIYEVVNPIIIGTLKIKYNEASPIDAAKMFWAEMSKFVLNEIPKSFFTIRDENGKLYHFKVIEKKNNTTADYTLTTYSDVNEKNASQLNAIYDGIISRIQKGGRKHRYETDDSSTDDSSTDDSSTDDSSDVDELINKFNKIKLMKHKQPIIYYNFVPNIYGDESIFVPSFIYPYMPSYMEIGFSTAFWK